MTLYHMNYMHLQHHHMTYCATPTPSHDLLCHSHTITWPTMPLPLNYMPLPLNYEPLTLFRDNLGSCDKFDIKVEKMWSAVDACRK